MYLSADDARSDFFLAGAVYVIGPSLISLLVSSLPRLFANTAGVWLIAVGVPLLTIAAMPLYLLRYREQSFAGLTGGGIGAYLTGLGISATFVIGAALAAGVAGVGPGDLLASLGPFEIARAVVPWASGAILAIFLYRRAEYAFRPISETQQTLVRQAGLACAGAVAVTAVLLLLGGRPARSVLVAAGLAAVYLVAERLLPQQGVGERWWVWAPAITLALGPIRIFALLAGGASFLASVQRGAGVALFALVTVMALHNRRGPLLVFGLATGFALAQLLGGDAARLLVVAG
ncbi:hypothetical protein BH23ACT9_BH23ACT9_11660 [soil metagenome]